jgi:DNA-directed RNA polymerase subunit M/transcription elongation factor TFIIS
MQVVRLLHEARPNDVGLCRRVESLCHGTARTATEYGDYARAAAFNLAQNPLLGEEVLFAPDDHLVKDTLVGRIREETRARADRFREMLQEKYDSLNDRTFQAIVRCRRCGSEDVTWEEKQTRSADEGASLFCTCAVCKNRWVIR